MLFQHHSDTGFELTLLSVGNVQSFRAPALEGFAAQVIIGPSKIVRGGTCVRLVVNKRGNCSFSLLQQQHQGADV